MMILFVFLCLAVGSTIGQNNGITVNVSSTSSNNFSIAWETVSDADYYRTSVSTSNVEDCRGNDIQTTEAIITTDNGGSDLLSSEEYYVLVCAYNSSDDKIANGSTNAITVPGKADTPASSQSSSSSITLLWEKLNKGSVATTYIIKWNPPTNGGFQAKIINSFVTLNGLASNTAYTFTLTAQNSAGVGEASDPVTFNTAPGIPTSFNVSNSAVNPTNEIVVSWEKPEGGNTIGVYNVEWFKSDGSMDSAEVPHISSQAQYNYTITGLVSNTAFEVKIRAKSNANVGDSTRNLTIQTVPGKPKSLSVNSSDANRSNAIDILWIKPDGGDAINEYLLTWRIVNQTWEDSNKKIIDHTPGKTLYNDVISDLSPAIQYEVTVLAKNDAGDGNMVTANIQFAPGKPKLLSVSPLNTNATNAIDISWMKPDGGDDINKYLIRWKVVYQAWDGSNEKIIDHTPGETSYNDVITNLSPGTQYEVNISANNDAGDGEVVTRNVRLVPEKVTELIVLRSPSDPRKEITAQWQTPEGTGDNITVGYTSVTTGVENVKTFDFSVTNAALDVIPGNNYSVSVVVNSGKHSSEDIRKLITSAPSPLTGITITPLSNEIEITWEPLIGHADKIVLSFSGRSFPTPMMVFLPPNVTSYRLDNSVTNYIVTLYTQITDFSGDVERSQTVSSNPRSSSRAGLIGGLIAAAVILIMVIILIIVICKRRQKDGSIKIPAVLWTNTKKNNQREQRAAAEEQNGNEADPQSTDERENDANGKQDQLAQESQEAKVV